MLPLIPTLALVLLNLIVIVYVVRERSRTRSGAFLVINAVSLILWTIGIQVWRAAKFEPHPLAFASLASIAVGANLLYYAGSRPRPLWPVWGRWWMALAVFLPAVLATAMVDFHQASFMRAADPYYYIRWEDMLAGEGLAPLLAYAAYFMSAIVVLAIRSQAAPPGPERSQPRHLLAISLGTLLFVLLFAAVRAGTQMRIILSPGVAAAFIAQISILIVIRQEEVERPLYLSRWIYYSIIILIMYLAVHPFIAIYESVTAQVLLTGTIQWTVMIAIVVVVTMASLPRVQGFFDRILFRRAWEYRQLVREAQLELNETRMRLRRAERLSVIGEMASRIAHEIKNPLGPIKGYAEMTHDKIQRMEDFPQRESILRHLDIIAEEVENIDNKVRHLLDMSRQPDLTLQAEDLNRIAERAVILLQLEADTLMHGETDPTGRVVVHADLDESLASVQCDRPRIEEALNNLCRNAFEAVNGRGRIVVSTRRMRDGSGRDGAAILVEDDGPGFSESARQRLFEPFYTEKAGGTGLGLSIVKSHLDLHGGEVSFEPRAGGGVVAILWLPFGEAPSAGNGQ